MPCKRADAIRPYKLARTHIYYLLSNIYHLPSKLPYPFRGLKNRLPRGARVSGGHLCRRQKRRPSRQARRLSCECMTDEGERRLNLNAQTTAFLTSHLIRPRFARPPSPQGEGIFAPYLISFWRLKCKSAAKDHSDLSQRVLLFAACSVIALCLVRDQDFF